MSIRRLEIIIYNILGENLHIVKEAKDRNLWELYIQGEVEKPIRRERNSD